MGDQVVERLSEECDSKVSCGSLSGSEQVQENSELVDENSLSSVAQETPSDPGHTLPIIQKIIDLSCKVQKVKADYKVLSDQVKQSTNDVLGSELSNSVMFLSTEYDLLKKKYLMEFAERKQLYNELIELKGNIRVFCRCRPLNASESLNGCTSMIDFDSPSDGEIQVLCSDSSKKQFKFDHVFRTDDDQDSIFTQTRPIVTSVMDGYNVCIFAYGQTGTGKTYTMEGTPQSRGVNYRTLEELFRISEERIGVMKYELSVSMLEVYNEKIRDLLADSSNPQVKKLEVKQAAEGTQEIPGLAETQVFSIEEVWELLQSGNRMRSVGSTSANELSSRSHCLLRVTVKGDNILNGQRTKAHLWLVDLAGSERVGKTEVDGERLKESQFINKSLSALGDVISALASKTPHIPYRNSKLTHLLQSSLGGDCKTLMIVQISPSAADVGETLCSLNFASRVRGIEGGPARKQADLAEVFKYKQMVEKLKHEEKENKKLQETLESLQLRAVAREHNCKNLQEKVRDLENQLAEERKIRLKQETKALAAASHPTSLLKQGALKTKTETTKPPLPPSKIRLPLRRLTNIVPHPLPSTRPNTSLPAVSEDGKENIYQTMLAPKRKLSILPRRCSIAVRPTSSSSTTHIIQPKRRVSIATFRTDMNSHSSTPLHISASSPRKLSILPRRCSIAVRPTSSSSFTHIIQPKRRVSIATFRAEMNSHMSTPLHSSASRFKHGSSIRRNSFLREPMKVHYSRLQSPLMKLTTTGETTPIALGSSSSKFMASPPVPASSKKSPHSTAISFQRKPVVWSPLKLSRGLMKFHRRPSMASSLMPPRRPAMEPQ